MSKELEFNPETGEVSPKVEAPKSKFKKSLFVDEVAGDGYHSEIKFEGYLVYVRELSEEFLNAHLEAESELEARVSALGTLKPKASQASREQSLAATREIMAAQQKLLLDALEQAIVGWTLPREFSRSALEKLSKAARQALASKVIKSASLGQSDADFLAARS